MIQYHFLSNWNSNHTSGVSQKLHVVTKKVLDKIQIISKCTAISWNIFHFSEYVIKYTENNSLHWFLSAINEHRGKGGSKEYIWSICSPLEYTFLLPSTFFLNVLICCNYCSLSLSLVCLHSERLQSYTTSQTLGLFEVVITPLMHNYGCLIMWLAIGMSIFT